ncbi:DUF5777 family beta-barrel protein [Rhodohalobacter sp.]|uniref:DUF5777 family beta-barrel protein n=1 Tax=Rhodohalobacter sp. TaxID=1974210 RepID=UPI003563F5CF
MKQLIPFGILLCFILVTANFEYSEAQIPRERVQTDEPVSDIFWASSVIGVSTVRNLSAGNLNSTIAHIFGPLRGGIDRFFGLDDGANTRLGLDYGFTDRFSLGIGRMTFNKIVDFRGKYNILRQSTSGDIPFDLAIKFSSGISTLSGVGLEFSDRISYLVSVLAAKKFDRFSLQLTPMAAHFNNISPGNQNQLFGIGILSQYELNERFSISTEYLPVLGKRYTGTHNALGAALNINTGGHIFQIFFTSSQWHGEQFMMANNRDRFFEGDFRFGFNIHRVFGL